ncbi:MAG: hypothetical protein AAB527_02640 [Patescibacteria group bacterium]
MKERENLPFGEVGEKERGGAFFDWREIQKNPNLIVKELKPEAIKDFAGFFSKKTFGADQSIESQARRLNSYYEKLASHPSLEELVPKTNVVIGKNEQNDKTLFAVSEKIKAKKLNEVLRHLTSEEKRDLIQILEGLVDVYVQTYDGKQGLSVEFQYPPNMMFGKNANQEARQDRVYLVDLFPVFGYTLEEFKERIEIFRRFNHIDPEERERALEKLNALPAGK